MDAVKLHTVFITHNRLELTIRALTSYLETVTLPFSVMIVDNASSDGTTLWALSHAEDFEAILLPENLYPGYACNRGFEVAPADATLLHRADNDFIFLPGWCDEVARKLEESRRRPLGQLGLRTDAEEMNVSTNVGGNCIIMRDVWDEGARWDERPWPQLADEIGPGWTEDSLMSKTVRSFGRRWDRVDNPCIQPISTEDPNDPYYQQTWADRRIRQ